MGNDESNNESNDYIDFNESRITTKSIYGQSVFPDEDVLIERKNVMFSMNDIMHLENNDINDTTDIIDAGAVKWLIRGGKFISDEARKLIPSHKEFNYHIIKEKKSMGSMCNVKDQNTSKQGIKIIIEKPNGNYLKRKREVYMTDYDIIQHTKKRKFNSNQIMDHHVGSSTIDIYKMVAITRARDKHAKRIAKRIAKISKFNKIIY